MMVIGGSGFFGKSILDSYKRGGLREWEIDSILIVSRNASRLRLFNPMLLDSTVKLLDLDICTAKSLPLADYIIHAAASTNAANYLLKPDLEAANILNAVTNYCEIAKKFHRKSKILYISSGAVYGKQSSSMKNIPESYNTPTLEDLHVSKIDYANSKQISEKYIKKLAEKDMRVSIARCFAFVGKYLPLNQHFAIGNFMLNGMKRQPILVKSNHEVYRSYMYSDDLVQWLMSIMDSSSVQCPIYNVGSEQEISIRALAHKISKYYGVEVIENEFSTAAIDRYIPSTQLALKKLNLKCKFELDDAINQSIIGLSNATFN